MVKVSSVGGCSAKEPIESISEEHGNRPLMIFSEKVRWCIFYGALLMKTLLTILITLIVSQLLVTEYGPRNALTHFSTIAAKNVRSVLHRTLHVME